MRISPADQVRLLSDVPGGEIPQFAERIDGDLRAETLTTLQINVGKMCNQTCKHCHVDAGPTRKEIMTEDTMNLALKALDQTPSIRVVDLTGGAPEMNPHFRWFVEEIRKRGRHVIVRCNLTIIEANEKYADLPQFFAKHGVEVVSSLPFYSAGHTDRQRGQGVFAKSITALKKLNAVGYGSDPRLQLNLVYNPNGAFLPGNQEELETEFKNRLREDFGITFNHLFTITNMPIARFLEYLMESKNFGPYMSRLSRNFNPGAVKTLMCRSMISVSWDGWIYDCDFNQMLELKTNPALHLKDFSSPQLANRNVVVGNHCYGCTAGSGSSCGGSLT